MIILKDVFVIFVAVEALLIMLLEMFGTQTKPR
jgi:putative membrane protein